MLFSIACFGLVVVSVTANQEFMGTIQSPNYPNDYLVNSTEFWKLKSPEGTVIILEFNSTIFDIESENQCRYDYLLIVDMEAETDTQRTRFCGKTIPKNYKSVGNSLYVYFNTDSTTTGKGFEFTWYSRVPCANNKFECWDGTCLSEDKKCNGVSDCPNDDADEKDCPTTAGAVEPSTTTAYEEATTAETSTTVTTHSTRSSTTTTPETKSTTSTIAEKKETDIENLTKPTVIGGNYTNRIQTQNGTTTVRSETENSIPKRVTSSSKTVSSPESTTIKNDAKEKQEKLHSGGPGGSGQHETISHALLFMMLTLAGMLTAMLQV